MQDLRIPIDFFYFFFDKPESLFIPLTNTHTHTHERAHAPTRLFLFIFVSSLRAAIFVFFTNFLRTDHAEDEENRKNEWPGRTSYAQWC